MDGLKRQARKVTQSARFVNVDTTKLEGLCDQIKMDKPLHWLKSAPYNLHDLPVDDRLAYLFLLNSISFCYWGEPKWAVERLGGRYDGSWAMTACIGNALDQGIPLVDAEYLAEISEKDLQMVLQGNVPIPMFAERLRIVQEVGQVIVESYNSSFRNLLEEASGSAHRLYNLIIGHFPFFHDVAEYEGEALHFYKRAQLLVSDISHCFHLSLGLSGIEDLTACADYKIPQVLRRHGVFEYSKDLADRIDNYIQIPSGDPREVEIRACTIDAVEQIKEVIRDRYPNIMSVDVNDYLWLEGQTKWPADKPYHRTRTTAY